MTHGLSLGIWSGFAPSWSPLDDSSTVLHLDPLRMGDFSQDDAGATPVAAAGDPVGLFSNPAGGGDYSQSTGAAKPTFQDGYIEAASGDYLATTSHRLGLAANPAITITALVEITASTNGYLFSLGTAGSGGIVNANLRNVSTEGITMRFLNGYRAFGDYSLNDKAVISWVRIAGGTIADTTAFKNGVELANTTGANPTNTPNTGGNQSGIFAQANGSDSTIARIYGLTVAASSDASVREAIEDYWLARA